MLELQDQRKFLIRLRFHVPVIAVDGPLVRWGVEDLTTGGEMKCQVILTFNLILVIICLFLLS